VLAAYMKATETGLCLHHNLQIRIITDEKNYSGEVKKRAESFY
jgi:hypothetical protein